MDFKKVIQFYFLEIHPYIGAFIIARWHEKGLLG